MGCVKLLNGLDLNCLQETNKYYQSIVLINKADVQDKIIEVTDNKHRVAFNLIEGRSGLLFRGSELGSQYEAYFNKVEDDGAVLYDHNLQVPIIGSREEVKILLRQLDNSDFFAAIQLRNGLVEIYGFDNGLKTGDYEYRAQSNLGGAIVPLESRYSEIDIPYIYFADGNENEDFNNLFADIPNVQNGDFNNDFNNDFYISND